MDAPNYTITGTPTNSNHAITKSYVDGSLNLKQNKITTNSDISLNSLLVLSDFRVDGTFTVVNTTV